MLTISCIKYKNCDAAISEVKYIEDMFVGVTLHVNYTGLYI